MRILLATESYWPTISGVTIFTDNLARGLIAQGFRVAIMAPSHDIRASMKVENGLAVYRIPSLPNPIRNDTRLIIRQGRQIRRMFKNFQPDLVHIQAPFGLTRQVQRYAHRKGIPVIATHHFSPDFLLAYIKPLKMVEPITLPVIIRYLRHFYSKCDVVTCPTHTVARQLQEYRVESPIRVISNGVDVNRFTPGDQPRQPLALYVGRLDPDKNVDFLLEAVKLALAHTRFSLVCVGGGSKEEEYREWVTAQGLEGAITFTGRLPYESPELLRLYQSARLFLMPSPIETQSIVTMEAMSCRLPVIACYGGAIPELVKDGITGYLLADDDAEGMAARIVQLINNPEQAQAMGLQAQEEIMAHHQLERSLEQYAELYKEVLASYQEQETVLAEGTWSN